MLSIFSNPKEKKWWNVMTYIEHKLWIITILYMYLSRLSRLIKIHNLKWRKMLPWIIKKMNSNFNILSEKILSQLHIYVLVATTTKTAIIFSKYRPKYCKIGFHLISVSRPLFYHSGLSTLTKCHCEAVGLHKFYHHSDILSCITFQIK